jgi:hypothetical protein
MHALGIVDMTKELATAVVGNRIRVMRIYEV